MKLPKQQQAQGQDDPSVESPSSTSTADSEETGSADGEPARRANGSGIARGK